MPTTPTTPRSAPTGCRARGNHGVALVEFALVFILFFTLMLGIIAFGILLSFQQTMTQTANEAARAAAVTANNPLTVVDERLEAAKASIGQYDSWGRSCSSPGFVAPGQTDCKGGGRILAHDCGGLTQTAALPDCITVTLAYDYEHYPLLPTFPFVGHMLPNVISGNATAQISDGG